LPTIVFRLPDGRQLPVDVAVGCSVLDAARQADIAIEGACGGSMACATCHVIVDAAQFDALDPASDEEEDMLDLAESLSATSRLGCQLRATGEIEPLVVTVPRTSLL